MPKDCEVRFVLFVVLFGDVFFLFVFSFSFFWNNSIFLLPARCLFHLGTVQLALLVFCWLLRLAFCCCCWWAYFRDVPGLACRSKFRSLCLQTEQKVYRSHFLVWLFRIANWLVGCAWDRTASLETRLCWALDFSSFMPSFLAMVMALGGRSPREKLGTEAFSQVWCRTRLNFTSQDSVASSHPGLSPC